MTAPAAKPIVFSCITLPDHVVARMIEAFDLHVAKPGAELVQLQALVATGARLEAVITGLGCDRLTKEAIIALPASIRIIASYSVGTDHIDLAAAKARGIAVSNTPGTLVNAVADATMLMVWRRRGVRRRVLRWCAAGSGWDGPQTSSSAWNCTDGRSGSTAWARSAAPWLIARGPSA